MATTKIRGNTQIMDGTVSDAQLAPDANISTDKLAEGSSFVKKDGTVSFVGDQSMGGNKLTDVHTPVNDTDATNKSYVDDQILNTTTYVDEQIIATTTSVNQQLADSKTYVDTQIDTTTAYVDQQISATTTAVNQQLVDSKAYVDDQIAATTASVDQQILNTKTYVDGQLQEVQTELDQKLEVVRRSDVDTTTVGNSLITKVVAGTGVTLTSTGADEGTGEVTITVDPIPTKLVELQDVPQPTDSNDQMSLVWNKTTNIFEFKMAASGGNIDGGRADEQYQLNDVIDGGDASGI